MLDPEFAAVVEAWDRADDSAHGAFMTEGEMDGIADEALVNAANAGDPEATAALEAETERRIAEGIESEEQAQERWPEEFRLRQEWYEWSTYVDDLAKRVEEALGSDWVTRELRDHALTVKRLVEERQGARMI